MGRVGVGGKGALVRAGVESVGVGWWATGEDGASLSGAAALVELELGGGFGIAGIECGRLVERMEREGEFWRAASWRQRRQSGGQAEVIENGVHGFGIGQLLRGLVEGLRLAALSDTLACLAPVADGAQKPPAEPRRSLHWARCL